MKTRRREERILELLRSKRTLDVEEICSIFSISPATARRIFVSLVQQGEAIKTWGGIEARPETEPAAGEMLPSGWRDALHKEEKKRIAQLAASLVQDGEVLLIDGGTTTLQMAPFLANRPVRILTNSILIAHRIDQLRTGATGAEVFLTGGSLYPRSGLLVGPQVVKNLSQYHARWAFLSAGGLDEIGASNTNHLVVESEQAMIAASTETVILADYTKWQKKDMVRECCWQEVALLITDQTPPLDSIATLVKILTTEVIK